MNLPGFSAEAGLTRASQSYRSRSARGPLGQVDAQQFDDGGDEGADIEDSDALEGEDLGGESGEETESEDEGLDEEGEAA